METQNNKRLRIHAAGVTGLIIAEYLLGAYVGLLVKFPENAGVGQLWQFALGQPIFVIHAILGIIILFGSIAIVVRAVSNHNEAWKTPSILGLLGVLLAIVGGVIFTGTQVGAYSFVMSLGSILSIFSYGWGLTAVRGGEAARI